MPATRATGSEEDVEQDEPLMKRPEETAEQKAATEHSNIVWGVVAYAFCSASLLVINKVAVNAIPSPSFVLTCQLIASVVAVLGLKEMNILSDVESLKFEKVRLFIGISLLFCLCLWTNVKALEYANVETVIVFRACSPIAVAFCDYLFLGQALPSMRSWLSLIVIVLGAILYVLTDDGFVVKAYVWVCLYFVGITVEMVYVKYVVEAVDMSTWSRVYYNNVLSIIPTLMLGASFNEFAPLTTVEWTYNSIIALALSCAVGVGISYAGFNLRKLVTATTFTVIGVLCKICSVLLNLVIWDKHANSTGIFALVICILAGTFYQQSSKR
uniref:EamA domain-containing protein n=1 Tax=Rhizochromulina marina TaxID=1034831 RepID=A0A6U0XPX6_9STRA